MLIDEAGVAPVLSPPEGMAARRNFTATPLALARQMRDSLDFRRTSNRRKLELTSAGQMRLQQCRRNHISCGARLAYSLGALIQTKHCVTIGRATGGENGEPH